MDGAGDAQRHARQLPTETEIYILPDGRVVIADLPADLADLAARLGNVDPTGVPHVEQEEPLP